MDSCRGQPSPKSPLLWSTPEAVVVVVVDGNDVVVDGSDVIVVVDDFAPATVTVSTS